MFWLYFIGRTLQLGYVGTTTNLQIVLYTWKISFLNQATKKIPAKFSHPKKSSDHPCHLKSRAPPWDTSKGSGLLINLLLLFFFFSQTDNDPPHSFSQTFHLVPKDATNSNFFVLNDMFRLSLHHGWTSNAQNYKRHFVYEQERQMWWLF